MSQQESSLEFKRELGLFDSTMIVVGSMIGSGIFIVSADIARTVGSSGLLILVWLITGVITLIGALSYGELASMMPFAGGQYVYIREAYNPLVGFLYGWTLFLVVQTGTIAAVAVAFAKFTGVIIPWFSTNNVLLELSALRISAAQLLAIASVVFLTFVNVRGVKEGRTVQNVFTFSKTIALFGLIVLGFVIGSNAEVITSNFADMWSAKQVHLKNGLIDVIEPLAGFAVVAAIGTSMVGSLFSSVAWENITFIAAEVKDPKKVIPWSLFLGTMIVTVLYIIVNIAYLVVLPLQGNPSAKDVTGLGIQFASEDRVGTAAAHFIFGDVAVVVMAILIMISTFGCNNGLILAGARVFYAMSKDNLFFKFAKELNCKSVPAKALWIQAAWTSLLCLSGTYGQLLDYVVCTVLIFYILTIAGIFILRMRMPNAERPYKAFGYPYLPIIYILLAASISIILLIYKPNYTWPGLLIVALGIPVYFVWSKNNSKFR
ncbi:MAG: amino acid transporter [Ignavibacteria bacterium]|nr:MAG: amino acid transporter [Ignavibacteria bacterium]KAF0161305.1 MAG: amino acid transporter [Ignavibacteria bacterium]